MIGAWVYGGGGVALSLSVHYDNGIATLRADGELDLASAVALEHRLGELTGPDVTGVTVDLGGVTFVDSAGINALLRGRRLAESRAQTFLVSGATGVVRQVLSITGVWNHLSGTTS
jgi:anti-sigma B factor antagonist